MRSFHRSSAERKSRTLRNLSSSLDSLVTDLIPDADSALKVRSNNSAYVAAVREVWSSEVAARLVLDHTNAFYVRKDETPRKGPDKDKPYIVCEVCLDEPLIRSEMDARREGRIEGRREGRIEGRAEGIIRSGRRHRLSDEVIVEDIAAETGCEIVQAQKILQEYDKKQEMELV